MADKPARQARDALRIEDEAPADQRGVFCLEGEWDDDFRSTASIEPLLRLLLDTGNATGVVHRNVATPEGLFLHLDRWLNNDEAGHYPFLYLSFHGRRNAISFIDDTEVTLEDLEDGLAGRLRGRIVYFGACSVVDVPDERLKAFCARTEARAVVGYTSDVGWLESAAFDLFLVSRLVWSTRMDKAYDYFTQHHGHYSHQLGLKIVTRSWSSASSSQPPV